MTTIQQNYTNDVPVTITLASLADGTSVTSSAIDNSTDKYISAIVQVKVTTTTVSANGYITMYLLRSVDGGTTYDDYALYGTWALTNAQAMSIFSTNTASTTYYFSFNTASINNLPSFWKLVFVNNSGGALNSTAGNHYVKFTGNKYETV